MEIGRLKLQTERDLLKIRHTVKIISENLGFMYLDCVRIATAASELTRNIQEHAGKGVVILNLVKESNRYGFQMIFDDKGMGIENIEKVLSKDYVSEKGLGIGLRGARNLMDNFEIRSVVGKGTRISVIKWLESGKLIDERKIKNIKEIFSEVNTEDDIQELKSQNRELISLLEMLNEQNTQLQNLNKELELTNSGVLSLNQELDKKNEELDRKNEQKNKFMRALGHETRTPINSIMSLINLMKMEIDGELNSEQRYQAELINDNASYLLNLINDLLDLSKIEDGFAKYEFKEIRLGDIVSRSISILRPLANEKGINLDIKDFDKEKRIEVDSKYMQQVILNIAGNAIKYTDEGKVELEVQELTRDKVEYIEFKVTDTGIGIPKEKLTEIFVQFKRVYSRDDIIKGSGLGLSIAKGIVDDWGGSISVTSELNKGSEFRILIPVKSTLNVVDQATKELVRIKKDKTILVVSETRDFVLEIEETLKESGYAILAAEDYRQALQLVGKYSFNMMIQELRAGEEASGWNFIKAVKYNDKLMSTPLMLICENENNKQRAKSMRVNRVITKPFNPETLKSMIADYQDFKKLKKVMVIDDNKSLRHIFNKLINSGKKVILAKDGKEGIEKLQKCKPELIILDLIMPVMDGTEFLTKLKLNEEYRSIPVIVYSSKTLSRGEINSLERDKVLVLDKNTILPEELAENLLDIYIKLIKGV